jgi:intraflagellar transport protein 52
MFQVSDYSQLPDIATLAAKLKTCLQESDEVPRDITALFDNSLFKLDNTLIIQLSGNQYHVTH